MSDPLCDLFREAGMNRPLSTLAEMHEWAAKKIQKLDLDLFYARERIAELKKKYGDTEEEL